MTDPTTFESWAIVEVMGHARFAGYVTTQAVGGANFVRVDVPEVPADEYYGARPAFTKLLGPSSIYSITPCDEAVARHAAKEFRARPITSVSMPEPPRITAPQERAAWDDPDADPLGCPEEDFDEA